MPAYPNFCGSSYTSQSPIVAMERTLNWYLEPSPNSPPALYPTPGVTRQSLAGQVGVRGVFFQGGRGFAVIGAKFYEVNADWTLTERGVVANDGLPAYITTNGDGADQLAIAAGGEGYIYNLVTNDFQNPVHAVTFIGMIDEFFLALDATSSSFKISDSLDGLVWDPTQVLQRSDASDAWQSMLIVEPEVWLIGEKTSGVLFDNGASPFPFAPRKGLIIPYGTCAKHSPAVVGGNPIWLAQSKEGDRYVVGAQGYGATPISTKAMEWALSKYARVDDAEGFGHEYLGHQFYTLNFPSANATWVYDRTTDQWHERSTWDSAMAQEKVWRARCHMKAFGVHIFGDRSSGGLYRADAELGFDFGETPLRRLRRGPGLRRFGQRLFMNNWQLDLESGLGLPIGQGSDPQVMFRNSWDGGKVWSNERWRSAGKQGDYGRLVRWNCIGSGRHFVPEVAVTDPIPWRISGAAYNVPYHEAA